MESLTREEGIKLCREWMVRLEIGEEQVFAELRFIYECAPPAVQQRFAELVRVSTPSEACAEARELRTDNLAIGEARPAAFGDCTEPGAG